MYSDLPKTIYYHIYFIENPPPAKDIGKTKSSVITVTVLADDGNCGC